MSSSSAAPSSSLLRGSAVLVIWGRVHGYEDPEVERLLNDWWTYEHLPERLALPGFHRTRRYYYNSSSPVEGGRGDQVTTASRSSNYMVLYEVSSLVALTSPEYMHALNNPTPGTRKYMRVLSGMNRSACRVLASTSRPEFAACKVGGAGGTLGHIVFEAPAAADTRAKLQDWLSGDGWRSLCAKHSSLLAMHVLQHDEAATRSGSSTKSYDEVDFQRGPESAALKWMVLLEITDPLGSPFASYGPQSDDIKQGLRKHDVDLSTVTQELFGLFVVMEE
ncbi:hypothetical protein AYO21_03068 [Fonsecaea monophora]|uniref:EthD domain-containing protein n=1 Tax=Fonsecaea monophora TaxID=254056 RepID=A0A177FEV6_9EURO|nr:hypothetical protein AYO21_03068 [Fonsecaea monophora]KAH0840432.1 hypothetical protein FOPE_05962 [Fonsecaea pedrosoi]OAG42785.1 hypothetical protein AYO21_03068 [Fonsecaea monophora]